MELESDGGSGLKTQSTKARLHVLELAMVGMVAERLESYRDTELSKLVKGMATLLQVD